MASNKKKIRVFTLTSILVVIPACVSALVFSNQTLNNPISLKGDTFTFEYGVNPTITVKDFVDNKSKDLLSKMRFVTLIDNTTPQLSSVNTANSKTGKFYNALPLEKKRVYPAVGTYNCEIVYNGGEYYANFKIKVVDTTKPTLTVDHDTLTIQQYAKVDAFNNYFASSDISGIKSMSFDTNNLDLTKVGSYQITLNCSDNEGNELSKNINVNVVSKDNASNLTAYTDGSYPTIKDPDEDKNDNTTTDSTGSNTNDDNTPVTPSNPDNPVTPEPEKPTFVLPSNTDTVKYFLNLSDANNYAYDHKGTVTILTDPATGTVYYSVTIYS